MSPKVSTHAALSKQCWLGLCLGVLVCVGCSSESADWQAARNAGTIESYQQYLDRHPQGAHADEAREWQAYRKTEKAENTIDGWTAFLKQAHEDQGGSPGNSPRFQAILQLEELRKKENKLFLELIQPGARGEPIPFEWADKNSPCMQFTQVDFHMISLGSGLSAAEKAIVKGAGVAERLGDGVFRVTRKEGDFGWEFMVNTKEDAWRVFHAQVLKP
jgi:hypothetical protein